MKKTLLLIPIFALALWAFTQKKSPDCKELITVICTTNPIPTIPSAHILNESMRSLEKIPALGGCKKIIVFDGIQPGFEERQADYDAYKENVAKLGYENTELIFCEKWVHLAGAIEKALEHVTTPFVFIHQHDFVLQKPFALKRLLGAMQKNENIKYVRLNQWKHNQPKKKWGHHYEYDGDVDKVVVGGSSFPLSRTFGWSDNDHIARTDYYREFVLPNCGFGAMEWYLHPMLKEAIRTQGPEGHLPFGTYLLGDLEDGCYIHHSDGRNTK